MFVGEAIAIDALDGSVSVALDKPGPYVPGRHLLTWSAADLAGNRVEELQVLDVLPTVSFGQPIEVGEGGIVEAELLLNGYAPTYPVTIEYGIVGTAQGGQDYQVPDDSQVVTIEEGLNAFIEVQIIADSELEGAEEIVLTIESVSGAVSGTSARQLITIQETNRKPTVEISFKQNDRLVSTVLTSAGPVEVIATISDPNQEDSHQLNWQSSDSDSQIEMPETTTENSWFFSPDSLDPQFYQIQVNVTDDGQPSLNSAATSTFQVLTDTPVLLASTDQDNDGISDLLEGYGDADGDRIADYLDPLTALNLLPLDISGQMLQSEPGTTLRLGLAAFASNGSGARIEPLAESETSADAIETLPPAEPAFEFPSGVIDFEVTGLLPGSISNIVVPLDSAIPEAAQYRKYTTEFGWSVFAEDAENQISTALGGEGCPAPRDTDYLPGMNEGHMCVQLSIKDGGANDADGIENGIIQDPGGVAVATTPGDMETSGPDNVEEENLSPDTTTVDAEQPEQEESVESEMSTAEATRPEVEASAEGEMPTVDVAQPEEAEISESEISTVEISNPDESESTDSETPSLQPAEPVNNEPEVKSGGGVITWSLLLLFFYGWICSAPHIQPKAIGKVLGIVNRAISTYLINKPGLKVSKAHTSAVTLIQRFG